MCALDFYEIVCARIINRQLKTLTIGVGGSYSLPVKTQSVTERNPRNASPRSDPAQKRAPEQRIQA